nr:MAG TPA: hypothetical protein [Caudoviricetes sp.]
MCEYECELWFPPYTVFSFTAQRSLGSSEPNKYQTTTKTMPLKSDHAPVLVEYGRWQKNMEIVKCE